MAKTYKKADRTKFEKEMNAFFKATCVKSQPLSYDETQTNYFLDAVYYVNGQPVHIEYEVRCIDATDNVLSVMGRFKGERADFQALKDSGYDVNPFSGKWNFHMMNDSVDIIMNHLKGKYLHLVGKHKEAVNFL